MVKMGDDAFDGQPDGVTDGIKFLGTVEIDKLEALVVGGSPRPYGLYLQDFVGPDNLLWLLRLHGFAGTYYSLVVFVGVMAVGEQPADQSALPVMPAPDSRPVDRKPVEHRADFRIVDLCDP